MRVSGIFCPNCGNVLNWNPHQDFQAACESCHDIFGTEELSVLALLEIAEALDTLT